jgi:hypothetical protein
MLSSQLSDEGPYTPANRPQVLGAQGTVDTERTACRGEGRAW